MNQKETFYQRFFDLSLELLCVADFQGYFRQINAAFTTALGYSSEELVSQPYLEFVHPDDREKTQTQVEKLAQGEKLIYFENRYRHADGSYHILAWTAIPYVEENLIYATARDITQQQQIETALRVSEATNQALLEASPDLIFSCSKDGIFLDFKATSNINFFAYPEKFLGKPIVEILPTELAQKVMMAFEKVITTGEIQVLEYQLEIEDRQQYFLTRIVLGEADKILVIVQNISEHKQLESQFHLENELNQAILKQEFVLFYQPIISLSNKRITGFEALIRWQHPQKGLISPDLFIPLAEKTGLIVSLGYWIIQEACRQLLKWQVDYPNYADLRINVNLSSQQLCAQHLVANILAILNKFSLSPSCLKIEITESILIEKVDIARAILLELRQSDIELCLDDFGTGYSSLSYLHQFPFDIVKIDRSFIVGQPLNDYSLKIITAIITLAHTLGMKVVAEGIETKTQFSQLTDLSCDDGQGNFFGLPLPSQEAEQLLQHSPQWF